jgi:hypothetical protein
MAEASFFVLSDAKMPDFLTQIISDDARQRRAWRKTKITPATILLAAGGSDVLSTIREQKHLLHHRSHCRYHHRPQSARPVLAQQWRCFSGHEWLKGAVSPL